MALALTVDSLDKVDEPHRALYTQISDTEYRLDVSGGEDVTGLKNALAAERKAAREAEAKLKQFGDIDPATLEGLIDQASKAEEAERKAKEAALIAEGKVEELVLTRTDTMRREYENQLAVARQKADEATIKADEHRKRLEDMQIDTQAITAINETAIPKKDAMPDIMARCKMTWRMEEGVPTAFNLDGTRKIGKDGRSPMTFNEWVEDLQVTAPHLWEPSTGGGASGNKYRSGIVKNGYTQQELETMSPKEYAKLVREGKI